MAVFDHGKLASKHSIKVTSALCAFWGTAVGSIVALSLKYQFPFDIISQPFFSVECLSLFSVVSNGIILIDKQWTRPKLSNVAKCLCGTVYACVVFHVLAILFGAPVLESSRETFYFALLMTCLVVVPPVCVLGANGDKWTSVFSLGRPSLGKETVVYVSSISSVLGAWLGAIPIPLDWDRPWQVWPISCVVGALLGHCLAMLGSAVYLPLRHSQLTKAKLT